MAAAPADTLMRAYAAAYERLDRPWDTNYLFGNDKTWKTTPWLATDHPKHAKLMSLLEAGPQPANSARGGAPNDPNDAAYRSITGRALRPDSSAYKASKALVKLVQETGGAAEAAGATRGRRQTRHVRVRLRCGVRQHAHPQPAAAVCASSSPSTGISAAAAIDAAAVGAASGRCFLILRR